MRAGMIASAYGRSGRHLRFVTVITALAVVDLWLWGRFFGLGGGPIVASELALALAAASAGAIALYALWRRPLSRNVPLMTTPNLMHSLATHHAGHIVAVHLQDPDRLASARMSDPCPRQLGTIPLVSQTSLRSELVIAFAGMTAEEIFSGESGSHVADDLILATDIGADMVGRFGMSGSLVSLATSSSRRSKFIGLVLKDARARKELESLLRDAKRETMRLMLENRHIIITLRDALLRDGQLEGHRIIELIGNAAKMRQSDDAVLVDLRSASAARPLISVNGRP